MLSKALVKHMLNAPQWLQLDIVPEVVLLQEVEDKAAEELKAKCPVGVFDIEDIGKVTIESTGSLPLEVLFTEAFKILEDKCERVIADLS